MFKKIQKWYGILGPGFTTAEADNDAGAITTYIQAGALYGFGMFWLMALLLPITYFCQECVIRLGVVTQKGPITLIKEKFGNFWAKVTLFNLFIVNFFNNRICWNKLDISGISFKFIRNSSTVNCNFVFFSISI